MIVFLLRNTMMTVNNNISKIESLLFAAGEPVSVEKLSKFLKLTKNELLDCIKQMEANYQKDNRGLEIVKNQNQIQLVSAKENGMLVSKFLGKEATEELSRAGAEVLAVIAYRGPITRAGIEQIRGVNCSFSLRNLAMRGLIDRKENPTDSRSYIYAISFEFLRVLGLGKVEQLPDYDRLKAQDGGKINEINSVIQ